MDYNSSEPTRKMIESAIIDNGYLTMQDVVYLEFYNE
jgi:hypothetical protein